MKKIFTIILITIQFCCASHSFSQSKSPVKLGLRVAPNIGWMIPGTKGYSSDGARMGATIGFISDFYFAENYAFSTGMNFQFLNGKLDYATSMMLGDADSSLTSGQAFRKYNFVYMEIPLMIKMKTKTFGNLSYFGQIGFGTGFRLNATVKEHFEPDAGGSADNQYDFNQGTTLIRESILIGLGCEYHVDESSRIIVGISYSNSLNNVLTGETYKTELPIKSQLNFAELNIGFIF
ncbi:MAG: porin family protein [Bacteroidetes bacterium]|nr:porin family protein [Bacteroidota bacterium]